MGLSLKGGSQGLSHHLHNPRQCTGGRLSRTPHSGSAAGQRPGPAKLPGEGRGAPGPPPAKPRLSKRCRRTRVQTFASQMDSLTEHNGLTSEQGKDHRSPRRWQDTPVTVLAPDCTLSRQPRPPLGAPPFPVTFTGHYPTALLTPRPRAWQERFATEASASLVFSLQFSRINL